MRRFAAAGLIVALLFAGVCLAADIAFPSLTGRVVDQAGLLDSGTQQRLTQELADHETRTGQQVVVAIVKSLQGQTIEDYGYQLGRHWGIGQKDKDTGAILLVAPTEHKVRIEVGYGLEGTLTDVASEQIIQTIILPAFRQGQMAQGIAAGTEAILQVLDGTKALPAPDLTQHLASDAAVPVPVGGKPHPIGLVFFALFFVIWIFVVMRGGRAGMAAGMLGLGMQSWGGGGFSGGGFSGGGGSFGGGGASGSW